MPTSKLNWVTAQRLGVSKDPVQNRRNLAIKAWQMQKELFSNPNFRKKSGQKIRPKFQLNSDGSVHLFPFRGDRAILCEDAKQVGDTIDLLISEIQQGQFDAQLAPAEGRGRRGRPPMAGRKRKAA